MTAGTDGKQRIVIVGGGFAGSWCARALARRLRGKPVEVVLINRTNYFLFTPLLVAAGAGGVEPRLVVVSIRRFIGAAEFIMAEVRSIDRAAKEVEYAVPGLEGTRRLRYDHLALCLGSVTRLPPVPGLVEHGFEMKSLADAIGLRDRMIQMLEIAETVEDPALRRELLHFVVVGGNYTGVEVAGEFDAVIRRARKKYRRVRREEIKFTLVEMMPRILPALDEELATFATEKMRGRGIDVRLKTTVTAIEPTRATLSTGEVLSTRTVIWCAGIAPSPVIARSGLPTDAKGYILCEPTLRVQGMKEIWAAGDSAVAPAPGGGQYPPTAQHATRLGEALAKNIMAALEGREPEPTRLRDLGSLAALGCRTGVAKVFGVKLWGYPAWFLYRTFYLTRMPGVRRSIRIALDWTMDLILRPEHVQLGLHRPPARVIVEPGE